MSQPTEEAGDDSIEPVGRGGDFGSREHDGHLFVQEHGGQKQHGRIDIVVRGQAPHIVVDQGQDLLDVDGIERHAQRGKHAI